MANVVDELQLYLDVLGGGLRLFDGVDIQARLELTACTQLPHGALHLSYRTGRSTG